MQSNDLGATLTKALSGLQVGVANARGAAGQVGVLTTGSKEVQDAVRPLLKLQKSEKDFVVEKTLATADDENLGKLIDVTA